MRAVRASSRTGRKPQRLYGPSIRLPAGTCGGRELREVQEAPAVVRPLDPVVGGDLRRSHGPNLSANENGPGVVPGPLVLLQAEARLHHAAHATHVGHATATVAVLVGGLGDD